VNPQDFELFIEFFDWFFIGIMIANAGLAYYLKT
jgi:hypothetical protein